MNFILEQLKEQYPNGDPKFLEMMFEEIELYNRKNYDYASGKAGEEVDPNGNFNRVSHFFSMYPGIPLNDPRVLCLSYIMKQIDQVAWSLARGFEGKVEGLDPRLQDIAVYTNILKVLNAHILEEEEEKEKYNFTVTSTTTVSDVASESVISIPSVWVTPVRTGHKYDYDGYPA